MIKDSIIVCEHCGENSCYKQNITEEINLMSCLSCGFISNTIWKSSNNLFQEQIDLFPELYKDIVHEDINKDLWIPNVVNIHDKGIVFIDGTNEDDCEWVGVKSKKITNKEKKQFQKSNPDKIITHKPDMSTKKGFGKHGYLQALEYIGVGESY